MCSTLSYVELHWPNVISHKVEHIDAHLAPSDITRPIRAKRGKQRTNQCPDIHTLWHHNVHAHLCALYLMWSYLALAHNWVFPVINSYPFIACYSTNFFRVNFKRVSYSCRRKKNCKSAGL
jgi:hypothetical protein